jgi:class 3 adenylate cyclase
MLELKAKSNVSGWLIVLNWFLLVLLPVLCFKVGSEWYFSGQFLENKARFEPVLYSEIQNFSRDLDEKVMLGEKFSQFDSDQGFIDYQVLPEPVQMKYFTRLDASVLRKQLEETLGFPVLSMICHSVDTQNIDFSLNEKIEHSVKLSSRTMLKRMFSIFNRQPFCRTVFPDKYRPAFSREVDIDDSKIRENYGSGLLQVVFATIFKPSLKEREVYETCSSRIGRTGNLLFYYGQARIRSKTGNYNLGGYIAAVRLQDIPESKIVEFATKRSLNSDVSRRTGFLSRALPFPDDFSAMNLNGFIQENDRYALRAILPQVAMVRRIQRGTILPMDFSGFTKRTSVIEVAVANSRLQHPWQKYSRTFEFILKFYILLGTFFFVYVYLYSFNFRASISFKLSIASFFVCLIPVISLYMLNSLYKYHKHNIFIEDLKAHLEAKNSLIQRSIDEKFEQYGQRTFELAQYIETAGGFSPDQLKEKFPDWCWQNNADGIIFQNFNERKISFTNVDLEQNENSKQAWNLIQVLLSSLVEFLFTSPMVTDNPQRYSSLLTEGANNAESVHRYLVDRGRLQIISRVFSDNRLSGCLIQKEFNEQKKPFAFVAVIYSAKKILEEYFKEGLSGFQFHEDFGRFSLDTALFIKDEKKIRLIEECCSKEFSVPGIRKDIFQFREVEGKTFFRRKENGKEAFYLIASVNLAPYIVMIRGTFSRDEQTGLFDFGLGIYPLIVIALTILLANLFFVAPGQEFSMLMNEIAEGRLETKIKLTTGDEFEQLSSDVNIMTRSLVEKEQLEKFVSPDLINEINRHTEAEMLPGGEKVGATVVFSSFKASQMDVDELNPEDIVEQIDIFLGICNSICANNHGVIDKIIGNTMMMVFRGKFEGYSHAVRACHAATQIHQAMLANEFFACRCFTGISTGNVVSGRIGSKTGKLDYTVIGDTVNMAARLKALAEKQSSSAIIVSQSSADRISGSFHLVELEPVEIKGKQGKHRTWAIG